MKLYEYQTKAFFREAGIPVPPSHLASNSDQAKQLASEISYPVILKAQVLVNGRGKAGGVKLTHNALETETAANNIFATTVKGISVQNILVEKAYSLQKEFYLGFVNDLSCAQSLFLLSCESGISWEDFGTNIPPSVFHQSLDPRLGLRPYQIRAACSESGIDTQYWKAIQKTALALWPLFKNLDAKLIEINSLAFMQDGQYMALNGKTIIDDLALFRQPHFSGLSDPTVSSFMQKEAHKFCLGYAKFNGNIGCIVNGQGFALHNLDLLHNAQLEPANLILLNECPSHESVASGIQIISADANVNAIFLNAFCGLGDCLAIAHGLLLAQQRHWIQRPLFVRLDGNNREAAVSLLSEIDGLHILPDSAKAVRALQSYFTGGK